MRSRVFATGLLILITAASNAIALTNQTATTVLVVLGNQPLDDQTPTIDTLRRVEAAVAYATNHPSCFVIFTGAATAGVVSEAYLMARLARRSGLPSSKIILEEQATSTAGNARYTAQLVEQTGATNILIVSKPTHLESALPVFRKHTVFRHAQPLPANLTDAESIRQMEEYLRHHDNPMVAKRLAALRRGLRGID